MTDLEMYYNEFHYDDDVIHIDGAELVDRNTDYEKDWIEELLSGLSASDIEELKRRLM